MSLHRHPRLIIISIAFECIHYTRLLAVTVVIGEKVPWVEIKMCTQSFSFQYFTCSRSPSRKTLDARTCAIPMVMRNATGVLPSAIPCVHVVCAYSLTCSETDRDRQICSSHSHIRRPSPTKLVCIARNFSSGVCWIRFDFCVYARCTHRRLFFLLFLPLLSLFFVTPLILMCV